MIVAGRVSQKMARSCVADLRPDAQPQVGAGDGVCSSSGGMFNNYAIVQGVDHVVPVDMYLPGAHRGRDADRRDPQDPRPDPAHEARRNREREVVEPRRLR